MDSNSVAPESGQPSKAKIFISYSRKDVKFVDRLETALKLRGLVPLVDRSEIYAFEEWWQRIEALIAKADTVVFVISPDSVASNVCQKEIAFAASLRKRLAPIVWRRVPTNEIPEALARLHFVFFDVDLRFEGNADLLVDALSTDMGWIRKHTEFGEAARRWAATGIPGPRGLLLRSPLLEEAERWLASRPDGAPPPTEETQAFVAESRRVAAQRRRTLVSGLSAGLVAAIGLAGLALFQRGIAIENEALAIEERDRALLTQSRFLADLANQRTDEGDAAAGILLTLNALPDGAAGVVRPYVPESEAAEYRAWSNLQERTVFSGHADAVNAAAFSRDGRLMVTASKDGTVRLWDVETRTQLGVLRGHDGSVHSAAFSPDGKRVVTASADSTARLWDLGTATEIGILRHQGSVFSALFSPDGRVVVTTSGDLHVPIRRAQDNRARLWDVGTHKVVGKLEHPNPVIGAAFSPDGRLIVTTSAVPGVLKGQVSGEKKARIWDVKTGKSIGVLVGHEDRVTSAAFSPDGRLIVTASHDRTARLWDVAKRIQVGVLSGHDDQVWSASFSPDGLRVVTASRDKSVRLWDVETRTQLGLLRGHDGGVRSAVYSPNGQLVLTASDDATMRLWNEKRNGQFSAIKNARVMGLSPTGRLLVTGSNDGTVRLWDTERGAEISALGRHDDQLTSASISPDGRLLVTASADRTARLWDVKTGKSIGVLVGHEDRVTSAAFSPDGRLIVTASHDRTARLWDVTTRREIGVLRGNNALIWSASFSPDGRLVFTISVEAMRLWDTATQRQIVTLKGGQSAHFSPDGRSMVVGSLSNVAVLWDVERRKTVGMLRQAQPGTFAKFSPDGQRIVTFESLDHMARLWDVETMMEIGALAGHFDIVDDAAFSSNGRLLATASRDGTARLWDVETRHVIGVLKHKAAVSAVSFSPDGRRAITQLRDETIRIWSAFPTTQDLINHAREIVPRCLTRTQREVAFLDPTPPVWCIMMKKWPYHTKEWNNWLKYKRANQDPPMPDTSQWKSFLATQKQATPM